MAIEIKSGSMPEDPVLYIKQRPDDTGKVTPHLELLQPLPDISIGDSGVRRYRVMPNTASDHNPGAIVRVSRGSTDLLDPMGKTARRVLTDASATLIADFPLTNSNKFSGLTLLQKIPRRG